MDVSQTEGRRSGLAVFVVAAFALAALAIVAVLGDAEEVVDPDEEAQTDVVWSVMTRQDGSVEARAVDVGTFAPIDDVTVAAGPARSAVLTTVFNGQGVAQLLENGEVRWLGLTIDGDDAEPGFVERTLWSGAPEAEPDAIRLAAAGHTVVMAIEDGLGVYYPDLTGAAQRLRLWSRSRDVIVEVGGTADALVTGRGQGRLSLFADQRGSFEIFRKQESARFVEIVDAGTAVLMRFDDGSIEGIDLDSGVRYDVWSTDEPAVAVAVAGTNTISYVLDEQGGLHAVDQLQRRLVEVPGDAPVRAVNVAGRRGSVVAVDGTVLHFSATVDPELTVTWPADADAVHASLIEPVINLD